MLFNTLLVIVLSVSGEYYCEAENGIGTDTSPPKRLDEQYPPKSVSVSVSPSGEIVEGSSVTLTCSSDANPSAHRYTWFKNRAELSWRGSSYTIESITRQDAGEYYCEAGNGIGRKTSPTKHLDVQCVLSQTGWGVTYTPEGICALKGSSVDMSCSYSNPTSHTVQKTFWFIHWNKPQEPEDLSKDPEYSHRVEYLGNQNNDCTFRINQLRETDSKTYRFRFLNECDRYTGETGVALEVTDLQVMLNPDTVTEGRSVILTCSTTCTLTGSPAFIWYRDGAPLPFTGQSHQFTASSEDRGSYSCAVKAYELHSPAVALNVRYPPKSVAVSVRPSGEIVEGSSVTLTCSSSDANPPVQKYTWYKKIGSVFLKRGSEWRYTIHKKKSGDAGEYFCEAENVIGTKRSPKRLDVQYPPKGTLVSVTPSDEIVENNSVTLTCSSDASPPVHRYTWYKNNRAVSSETGGPEDRYTIKNITLQDAGEYYCVAGNGIGKDISPPKRLDVQYPPKSVSVSVSPSGEIVEGSSVTLTCSSDANPPVHRYTWYKNNRAELSWSGSSCTIKSITWQDAGEYYCEAQNVIGTERSPPKPLDVQYPPKNVSVSVSPSGEIVEDSSVTLTCSSDANPPVQNYTWYKNRAELSWRGSSYTFKSITLQDAGEYYCAAGNGIWTKTSPTKRLDVKYPPKSVTVSVSPSGEIVEGSSVTLTCSSSDANPSVHIHTWFNYRAELSWRGSSYTIKSVTLQDTGEYYCVAGNGIGSNRSPPKSLDVKYALKSVSVSVSPSGEIVEGSSVTLTCSSDANPPVQNYTWVKKNDSGDWQAGSGQSLIFSNFRSWNRGQYYCEAQNRLGAQNASALLVLIQDLQTGSERIVSFSNFTSWSFGQYYCVALNTHGDQISAAGDMTALLWTVVGITVAFALFTVMVCTSRKKSTNRERGRSRRSRTSRAFRE